MRTNISIVVAAYVRLSVDEAGKSVSGSIENQISLIKEYCAKRELIVAAVFQDDGWSGGNFERPGFKKLLEFLRKKSANTVITVDLSRLGRNMREASYYAEEYFPEHGIHFFTISDGFDTARENVFAPFQFAMNEVYLRDGSRKVKNVLKNKRESGQYCACPPYGYKKNPDNVHQLIPDEVTAPVVQRIFAAAASGDSSRKIAMELNAGGIIPPLKYRVLYRDHFGDEGASHASDLWNYTTIKRILKNEVYLGHTLLGKTRKASIRSEKKLPVPQEDWAVTRGTHLPLVSQETFDAAALNLGKGTRNYQKYDHVRKSIFSGIAVCGRCGYSLCSCGTVYKGEREKYWYLSCTRQRPDIAADFVFCIVRIVQTDEVIAGAVDFDHFPLLPSLILCITRHKQEFVFACLCVMFSDNCAIADDFYAVFFNDRLFFPHEVHAFQFLDGVVVSA